MKKTSRTATILAVAALSISSAFAAPSGLLASVYSVGDAKFSIVMPGFSSRAVERIQAAGGPATQTRYTVDRSGRAYIVSTIDYSYVPAKDYVASMNGFVRGVGGGTIEWQKSLDVQGYPGYAYRVRNSQGTFVNCIVIVGSRLYQVAVMTDSGEPMTQEAVDFYDSLRIY